MSATAAPPGDRAPATLRRRLAAMVYELLIVVAIAFLVGLAFVLAYAAVTGTTGTVRIRGPARLLLQLTVLAALGAYFVWFWRLGRTLPMRTWGLQLLDRDGTRVSTGAALVRFLVATVVFVPVLVGLLELRQDRHSLLGWTLLVPFVVAAVWSLVDRERQTLWDRMAGTRLVHVANRPAAPGG